VPAKSKGDLLHAMGGACWWLTAAMVCYLFLPVGQPYAHYNFEDSCQSRYVLAEVLSYRQQGQCRSMPV
jgi:hypothetical protein